MQAEIISVGTELLLGHTINKDAAIVGRMLAENGIDLLHIQTVGDNTQRLANALALAASRSDIIITTGGLGPTDDDLTKSTIADFAGRPLREHLESLARLKEYFGSRKMSPNQIRQAWLPEGSHALPNAIGTAPGCIVNADGKHIIMLPGPPRELTQMLETGVKPFLASLSGEVIYSTVLRTFGIGEGAAADLIKDLMANSSPSVAPYAHGGEMFVKITAKAPDLEQAKSLCRPIVREVKKRLGDVVYGQDVDSLEAVVLTELLSQHKTIATAESCTGGLLAKRITDLPGASEVFHLGLVTYSNSAKERILEVPGELIEKHGAVSSQVAEAMAENAKKLANSDLAIGITGIAGPDGATEDKPLGLVYIALATANGTKMREMRNPGRYLGRQFTRERATSHALDMCRRYLAGLSEDLVWR